MSTQIKRLQQSGSDFVPITLSEAVVVNCGEIPGLSSLGITTLERVLRALLGIVGTNAGDIEQLEQLITQINTVLDSKQNKLTPGNGIEILPDGTINATFSTTLYVVASSLPSPSQDCANKIYIIPNSSGDGEINNCNEYICVEQNGNYFWEQIGSVTSDVNLDGYVTTTMFNAFASYVEANFITAVDVTSSEATGSIPITLTYEIPETIHDYLI